MEGFHYDAHPMGMFVSGLAALSTYYPEAKDIFDPENRDKQILRLIAKTPTLAAYCHRFSVGQPTVYPDNSLTYAGNFLNMMWKVGSEFEVHPTLSRALDVLFILHADHEQNCGTTAMRVVGSSQADPYSACAAAAAALYGPLHGGANEQVVRMLTEIGSYDNVPAFIESVKAGKGRLMGFGHRVYKNYDPRATIIKKTADEVFEITGRNPLLDIALKLEEVAAPGRLLRQPQAVPERRLLLRPHLPGHGLPDRHVHGAVRHPPHVGLAHALGRAAQRQGAEDRPSPPAVHRRGRARLRRPSASAAEPVRRGLAAIAWLDATAQAELVRRRRGVAGRAGRRRHRAHRARSTRAQRRHPPAVRQGPRGGRRAAARRPVPRRAHSS